MGSRSGSITVPLCRNWNYPTSDPTFRLQIGSHAQVPDEYITLQEETLGVRRDSVLVGVRIGGIIDFEFPVYRSSSSTTAAWVARYGFSRS